MNTARRIKTSTATDFSVRRCIACVFVFLISSMALAEDISSLNVMALSAQDQKAIIKNASGEMKTLSQGDVLAGLNVTVEKIMADKLVLRDNSNNDEIWISVAAAGKNSEVTRLSKQTPKTEAPPSGIIYMDAKGKNLTRSKNETKK